MMNCLGFPYFLIRKSNQIYFPYIINTVLVVCVGCSHDVIILSEQYKLITKICYDTQSRCQSSKSGKRDVIELSLQNLICENVDFTDLCS